MRHKHPDEHLHRPLYRDVCLVVPEEPVAYPVARPDFLLLSLNGYGRFQLGVVRRVARHRVGVLFQLRLPEKQVG